MKYASFSQNEHFKYIIHYIEQKISWIVVFTLLYVNYCIKVKTVHALIFTSCYEIWN